MTKMKKLRKFFTIDVRDKISRKHQAQTSLNSAALVLVFILWNIATKMQLYAVFISSSSCPVCNFLKSFLCNDLCYIIFFKMLIMQKDLLVNQTAVWIKMFIHFVKIYACLFHSSQDTLVHAQKLWAEEISKRASLYPLIKRVFSILIGQCQNNRRVPRRSFV